MTAPTEKRRVFSGIQPTGRLHVGNYLGALRLWAELQRSYDCIFCVADLHALTVPGAVPPERLRRKIVETAALVLACGIDPHRSVVFVQSRVPAHAELAWLLSCATPVGWLERMTQYKAKAGRLTAASAALLVYPVLQAADILLYKSHLVPVGEDQKQHIELARDIAQRFHGLYSEVFVIPEPLIRPGGARIMGLDDPAAKMSKSLAETRSGHAIGLTDSPDAIRRAVMRAVTDSGNEVRFDRASSGVRNLLEIYTALSGQGPAEAEARFAGRGYGRLKREVADVAIAALRPFREEYERLMRDPDALDRGLVEGADRARSIADATLEEVKRLVGLAEAETPAARGRAGTSGRSGRGDTGERHAVRSAAGVPRGEGG
jgi:tryptophanyl-tRNA synthetase